MATLTCIMGTLTDASFRGVPFWVKSDKEEYGRRIQTHEYPYLDTPYNEDMGAKAEAFHVSGYVVGDDAFDQKEAVAAACKTLGSALLVLPAKPPLNVVCLTCAITRSKDDQGIFEIEMEFKGDPGFGISPIDVPVFESLIGGLLSGGVGLIAASFNSSFSADDVLPYVVSNAVQRVASFAQSMSNVVESVGMPGDKRIARATTALIGLSQNAPALVQPGPNPPQEIADLPTTVGDVFNTLMQISNPALAAAGLQTLAAFTVLEQTDLTGAASYGYVTPLILYSGNTQTFSSFDPQLTDIHAYTGSQLAPSRTQDAANAAAFNGMVRCFALIAYAKALAATVFTNRPDAIQARATLAELFQAQMERTMDYDLAVLLQTARDYCVTSITRQIASIIPVVTVTSPITLPSLYWAGRLYNDATRALELSDRNLVPTPAYMPQKFEALAN